MVVHVKLKGEKRDSRTVERQWFSFVHPSPNPVLLIIKPKPENRKQKPKNL